MAFPTRKRDCQKAYDAPFQEGFEITYEDLGNDSSLLGAAGLAFDSFG